MTLNNFIIFGHTLFKFEDRQLEVINALINGQDCCATTATGISYLIEIVSGILHTVLVS